MSGSVVASNTQIGVQWKAVFSGVQHVEVVQF
jgi:hypothetical protein